jgi:hypothetical protein
MANNRLYLVHEPSMTGVFLGKRMAWGWYFPKESEDLGEAIKALYEYVEGNAEFDQDAFVVWDETSDKWRISDKHPENDKLILFGADVS